MSAQILTPARMARMRFMRHRAAVFSAVLLALLTALAFAAPLIEAMLGLDATQTDLFARFEPPSAEHPLGTDELGRDLLLRLLYGGQVSLSVGIIAAFVAAFIGTVIGLAAGYRAGWVDAALMRLTDTVIALPLLPVLIVLAALDPTKLGLPTELADSEQASLLRIIIIVSLFGWTVVARLVRGAVLSVRNREYVRAAEAMGVSPLKIAIRHVLPNVASPIIIATSLSVGNIILMESVLSFLGLGIQPPVPSWGNMLTSAQEMIWEAPHQAVLPGLLIFLTVMSFNFLGDGLQNALDPRAIDGRAKGGN